jgi:predicted RNase H-like HicB family nuclease
MFRYPIIIEEAEGNYSAYSPDLPGCVATGSDKEETLNNMRGAILFHLEGLKNEGMTIPSPSTTVTYLEIPI